MRRLPARCAKDVVPKRRADAEPDVVIPVMMAKMILFQPEPGAAFHGEMVDRVMHHVVADIAEHQPGECARRKAPEN